MGRDLSGYPAGMSETAIITPIDGWGFHDAIDGLLAPPFEVDVAESGGRLGNSIASYDIRGWRGTVMSSTSKYRDMAVEMTPRHVDWDGVIVLKITDGDRLIFSGMAETTGLDCTWK
jgi:hypothetical protein